MSYCTFCSERELSDHHRIYHDNFYGFPIEDDNELFGRLILEINQAGLSWNTILLKQNNFRLAFDNFSIEKIADYDDQKFQELMMNAGIIRNRLKINSVIHNAKVLIEIKEHFGTFKQWLDANHPKSKEEWTKLFKKTFKFVGGEIVNEFLMSSGYLKGAHEEKCATYSKVKDSKPKWLEL
jgi:DNA-3-methyladenine glycosylase I